MCRERWLFRGSEAMTLQANELLLLANRPVTRSGVKKRRARLTCFRGDHGHYFWIRRLRGDGWFLAELKARHRNKNSDAEE